MKPNDDASMTEIMKALDTAVMQRGEAGVLTLVGDPPGWLCDLFPGRDLTDGGEVSPGDKLFFLENFLVDAEEFWNEHKRGMIVSEFWQEEDLHGNVLHLQASALTLDGNQYLLIGLFQGQFTEKQQVVQRARENALMHESLVNEIQKKEVLLHAIVHDLSGPLTSMSACFDILLTERLGAEEERSLVELGKRVAQEQKHMIDEILGAFSSDIRSVDVLQMRGEDAPDVLACAEHVAELHGPAFAVRGVELDVAQGKRPAGGWKGVADNDQLVRVIANLVENALRHTPDNSRVTIGVSDDGDFIRVDVDDEGPGVAASLTGTLFHSFVKGKERAGKSGLGLYFCRITLERWGGDIGVAPGARGGACFWIRLRKPVSR